MGLPNPHGKSADLSPMLGFLSYPSLEQKVWPPKPQGWFYISFRLLERDTEGPTGCTDLTLKASYLRLRYSVMALAGLAAQCKETSRRIISFARRTQ